MPNVEDAIQTENHYFPAISLKWESAVRKKSFAKIPFAAVGYTRNGVWNCSSRWIYKCAT